MNESDIIDWLLSWLKEQNFKIKLKGYRFTGPDIIAERKGETWIIEVKQGFEKTPIDTAVGQLIRRMYIYGIGAGKKYFLAVYSADKIDDYIFDLGIGVLIVMEHAVRVLDAKEPRFIPVRSGATTKKTEKIRVRCSELTKRAFYAFMDEGSFKTLEDGLVFLLNSVYPDKYPLPHPLNK